jgi:hypothetical protein
VSVEIRRVGTFRGVALAVAMIGAAHQRVGVVGLFPRYVLAPLTRYSSSARHRAVQALQVGAITGVDGLNDIAVRLLLRLG